MTIQSSILKTVATKEALFEIKENNIGSSIYYENEYDNDKDSTFVKDKCKKHISEDTENKKGENKPLRI